MKLLLNILLSLIIIVFLNSCSQAPYAKILPLRNIDKFLEKDSINTNANEIAPYIRVAENDCISASNKEFNLSNYPSNSILSVKPSNYFFKDLIGITNNKEFLELIDYLTNRLESIAFLTNNSGVIALSHPPDSNYSNFLGLPFKGSIGGTDLFTFTIENGKYIFRALNEPINSIFWDSHPWIGLDSNCNLLLIWASDRDAPYSITKDLQNGVIAKGNSDLYYCFRINNSWTEPRKFGKSINTEYNEISPFVYCLNNSPKLYFSSNKDKDFDIYECDLDIDFINGYIKELSEPILLKKGSQFSKDSIFINTDANEIFPFIAFPYFSNIKSLYISSDRNNKEFPINSKRDTLLVNKGNYDIYYFDIELDCKKTEIPERPIPKVELFVSLIDEDKNEVIQPIIKIIEKDTKKEVSVTNFSKNQFELELNKEYLVLGGSYLRNLNCNSPEDKIIQFYTGINFELKPPIINKKETKIEYDTLENKILKFKFDTTYVTELIPINNVNLNQETTNLIDENNNRRIIQTEKIIKLNQVDCYPKTRNQINTLPIYKESDVKELPKNITFVEATKEVIKRIEWYEGGKNVKKTKNLITYDTITVIDTLIEEVNGANIKSKLTQIGSISTYNIDNNIQLFDTIVLKPHYYIKPPCNIVFDSYKNEYHKNVPYYQTAFWKVNTTNGLNQHLIDLQKGNYLESAGYIELSPKHRKYGVMNKELRIKRIEEYRNYAKEVDINLNKMRETIVDEFIPALEKLLEYSPDSKLILKLEAYSDIRDAGICYYIGNTINYIQGKINDDKKIELQEITIRNRETLGSDNDNLSKLRVYFGFLELFNRLRNNRKFNEYFNKGLVFYPTINLNNKEELEKSLEKAKIIILAEGKFFDPSKRTDEKDYDPIRRLNLEIKLVEFSNRRVIQSPCCK